MFHFVFHPDVKARHRETIIYLMTKHTIVLLSLAYLYALNLLTTGAWERAWMVIWPGLVLLILLMLLAPLHRWLVKPVLAVLIASASVALFFKGQYGITLTEDIMLSGLINDTGLTAEMVSLRLLGWVLLTGLLPAAVVIRLPVRPQRLLNQGLYSLLFIALSAAAIAGIFQIEGYQLRSKGQIRDPRLAQSIAYFSPVDVLYTYSQARKALKKLKKNYASVEKMSQLHHYRSTLDDLLVIVVLGESTRGDHFALNGYPYPTNPALEQHSADLFSFRHVRACDTLTIPSLRCLASPMQSHQPNRNVTHSPFSEVMQSQGFSTDIYSLQNLSDFYQYLGYDKLVSKYAVLHASDTGSRDVSLLPFARKAIANYRSGRKLLILHTLGSHQTYNDRLLDRHRVFQPSCTKADVRSCDRASLIHAYDNTLLAVDEFLASLIEELADKRALLVYVSDHGESLGENGIYFHGAPLKNAPREQLTAALMFWFSPAFGQSPPGQRIINALKAHSLDEPVSHDHVFHSILGCSGFESDDGGIDPALNLCQQPNATAIH